jgi:mannose-6-phosphate isomerase-like protein (cupin superfamily)
MARILHPHDAELLKLRGRSARQVLSGDDTDNQMTVRLVQVEPEVGIAETRPLHVHHGVGEFIWILEGNGFLHSAQGVEPAGEGECVYVPPGELHKIVPSGNEPLHLLCVFPTGDIAARTKE